LVSASNILVSVNKTATNSGNSGSLLPAMTPDAQGIVFLSRASDLVEGITDTNRVEDVFFRDRLSGLTTLISIDAAGTMACGVDAGTRPAVSVDGRYVAFVSSATGLVAEPRPSYPGLFLRDRQTGITHWLMQGSASPPTPVALLAVTAGPRIFWMPLRHSASSLYLADLQSPAARLLTQFVYGTPAVSADGNRVAYWAPRTGEPGADLCVLDLLANLTDVVVSLGEPAFSALANQEVSLTGDGRFLAFAETSDTLSSADQNGLTDIYVADLQQPGHFTLASVSVDGTAGNGMSTAGRLSADGRYVVFRSWASNLAPWDHNGQPDIFGRDLLEGVTRLLSQTVAGDAGDRASFPPLISANGHTVAFGSVATDLFPEDLNLNLDLFATSVPASATADADGDGLADAWELYHFGTLGWGPMDDADGDGMSNLAEQGAGTTPWDPTSVLWLRLEWSDADPEVPVLIWPGVPGRTYQLEYRDRLGDGSWQEIPMTPTWQDPELRQPDVSSPRGPERFYRLRIAP
jgi:Tol biopolymer transport system component